MPWDFAVMVHLRLQHGIVEPTVEIGPVEARAALSIGGAGKLS